jgi:hypothetical protein
MKDSKFPKLYSDLFHTKLRFPGIEEDFLIYIDLPELLSLKDEEITEIKKSAPNYDLYNLPIFVIQSHGALSSSITLNSRVDKSEIRSVEFSRDNNLFKITENGNWVIYNSPVGTLGIASDKDNKFVNYINENQTYFKNRLFSNNPREIYDLTNGYYKIKNNSFFLSAFKCLSR